jgi:hypothetical protein
MLTPPGKVGGKDDSVPVVDAAGASRAVDGREPRQNPELTMSMARMVFLRTRMVPVVIERCFILLLRALD